MSTINTENRGYVFPLKDENLESSNNLLKISFFMIDSDIQNLFDTKADIDNSISPSEVDQKISQAITDYDNNLDIYGTYVTEGDVYTDPNQKNKLLMHDVFPSPGTYTKVTVNSKGLVTFGGEITKSDITDFSDDDYIPSSALDDTKTTYQNVWSALYVSALIENLSSEIIMSCVSWDSYNDGDVLNKIKNVDGENSGLDADLLDGNEGSYYLSWNNFINTPTTLSGYGIIDASVNKQLNVTPSSGNVNLDLNSSEVFFITLDQDVNMSFSNLDSSKEGVRGSIILVQDSTGNRNVTFGSEFKFSGGSTLSTSPGAIDKIDFVIVNDGTNLIALCDLALNYN